MYRSAGETTASESPTGGAPTGTHRENSAAPVASTYPSPQGPQGKTRLASLRGYPTRTPADGTASRTATTGSVSMERRRPTTAATASSHADHATVSLNAFMHRLRGYHTFQPLFTSNPAYPFLLEGSRVNTDPAYALAYVDRMLDATESQLLRHHGDDEFNRMVESFVANADTNERAAPFAAADASRRAAAHPAVQPLAVLDVGSPSKSAMGGGAAEDGDLVLVATTSESQRVLHSQQRSSDTGLATTWEPHRTSTTTDDFNAADAKLYEHQRVWEDSELERHRRERARYLENLHLEIEVLERQTIAGPRSAAVRPLHAQEGRLASSCESPVDDARQAARTRHESDATAQARARELDNQRAAWLAFMSSEETEPATDRTRAARSLGVGGTVPASASGATRDETETDARVDVAGTMVVAPTPTRAANSGDDVHSWLYGAWSHRTHRHENAALIIQRAYRMFVAKCTAARRACARELAFQDALQAEVAVRLRWLHAERRVNPLTDTNGDLAIANARAARFVADKLSARMALRRLARAKAAAADAELRRYAATTIQRVFRGHQARIEAHCLRSPRYREERDEVRLCYHATVIQRRWRRNRPHLLRMRRKRAAEAIQRWYRSCVARRRLRELRTAEQDKEATRVACYAVAVLERFFSECLTRKHAFYRAHKPHVDILQRCGRGYVARAFLMNSVRTEKLRALVSMIETRRARLLTQRRAANRAEELRQAREAQYDLWVRTDAAVTIQRAWRVHTRQRDSRGRHGTEAV